MQLRIVTLPGNTSATPQRISPQPRLALVDEEGMPTLSRAEVRRLERRVKSISRPLRLEQSLAALLATYLISLHRPPS